MLKIIIKFRFKNCLFLHHSTQPSTETVGEGFRRKDQEKSRRWLRGRTARVQEGDRNSRRDVRPETDGGEETGGTGQYGSGVRRLRESFWRSTQRDGDGDATVDGCTRSGSEDGWGHVREDNNKSGGGRTSFGGVWCKDWTEAGQRAEPAAVHSSTGPHQQDCCRKTVVKDAMKKLLYADDLALVANGKQELQEILEEWNGLFTKHGLKLNLEKTEVLQIGHQREELDIELEGKKLTQRDSFVYLGGAVCGDGKTEREVRRRVKAGANAWRAVEGVMADRRISKRVKGKVMSTCVTPVHACTERKPWHWPNYNKKGCKCAKTTGYEK